MKKLPKDIQKLLDGTPKWTEEKAEQLRKAAEELNNDPEFQKDLARSVEEEKILYLTEAIKEAWFIMDNIYENDDVDKWQNDYEHIVFKDAFEDLKRETTRRKALDDMTQKISEAGLY